MLDFAPPVVALPLTAHLAENSKQEQARLK
jgi:hypothetical protein